MTGHGLGNLNYPANPYVVLADMLLATLFIFILYSILPTIQATDEAALIRRRQNMLEQESKRTFGDDAVRVDKPGSRQNDQAVWQKLEGVVFVLKLDAASVKFIFVNDVLFTPGGRTLTEDGVEALKKLNTVIGSLKNSEYAKLVVEGHAVLSEGGRRARPERERFLQALSTDRANVVLDWLVSKNITPAEKTWATGSGWHNPIRKNKSKVAAIDQLNRRVQIEVRFTSRD